MPDSPIFTGSALGFRGVIQTGASLSRDPERGDSWRLEYSGSQQSVETLASQVRANPLLKDARIDTFNASGDVYKLVAHLPFWPNFNAATIKEEWTTSTETLEKDAFQHPGVLADIVDSAIPAAVYRKAVEDQVDDGVDPADDPLGTPMQEALYNELARGATGFETEYETLTRTRRGRRGTFVYSKFVGLGKYVWQTGQLNLPGDLSFSIPANPVAIAGTVFGWRLRDQDVRLVGDKIEETITWTLAYWSSRSVDVGGSTFYLYYEPAPPGLSF